MTKKKTKLHYFKAITQYGIHIWAILIIANAALAYAFQFSTHAAQHSKPPAFIADATDPTLSVAPSISTAPPSPPPHGQLIDLTFTIPGIGSSGGNLQPKRTKRNVTVFLYSTDVNSANPTVKPLYTIKTKANFENDSNSPIYTSFGNHALDLGVNVKDAKYQIVFRTDESLRTVVKESSDQVGGQIFDVTQDGQPIILPMQTVLMGDTIPKEGDNVIDISDYNAFINCFGDRNNSDFCKQNNYGDFDDNGVIDGVDYNILLRTFQSLLHQGVPIPQVTATPNRPQRISRLSNLTSPTPKVSPINKAPKVTPTAAPAKSTQSTGNVLGGILFFFFLIILGVIGFLYLKNENFRNKIRAIIHMSPTGTPDAPPAKQDATPDGTDATSEAPDTKTEPEAPAQETPAAQEPTAAPAEPTAEASPEDIAASTEISIPAADGTIEKSCYVKKRLSDDAKTGFWLTLTDDNGAVEAHFTTKDVADGFAKVKGIMKEENGKKFLEVSELTPEG